MHLPLTPSFRAFFQAPALRVACAAALALGVCTAHAERGDRAKPMVVEADKPGTVDLQRQTVVFNGNVSIVQGTLVLRAERVELKELPDGSRAATAFGSAARPATYRQKRDGVDEFVEGAADRIEYDGRADVLRFVGNGSVRRLRGGAVADEITGSSIVWDATAEVFSVQGGAASPANPGGRVRAVLSPRADAAGQRSAPDAAAPAASAALQPNRALGERP